jgi:enoyl-CoA hydratase/carnithine racemase
MSTEPLPPDASQELLIETRGRIRILTLNRPERSNSLTPELARDLAYAVWDAGQDPDIRVIMITGSGDRVFCSGADIKAYAASGGRKLRGPNASFERAIFEVILETWKPTIAVLNGTAVGGGLEMALACDLRIAGDHVQFGLPEARRGMGAHFASIVLTRMIPPGIAFEMLYRGRNIDAEAAARWGLVNHVVPKGEAFTAALAIAEEIAGNAPITLRRMKETAIKASGLPLAAALRLDEGISPYLSEDREEGFRAFLEKRAPEWKNR